RQHGQPAALRRREALDHRVLSSPCPRGTRGHETASRSDGGAPEGEDEGGPPRPRPGEPAGSPEFLHGRATTRARRDPPPREGLGFSAVARRDSGVRARHDRHPEVAVPTPRTADLERAWGELTSSGLLLESDPLLPSVAGLV